MASDGDSDQDFVTFGTPLEPLEEDEPLRKPIPVHEQTVKDEKGRYQRFHGAFTGGFSAGYFNTVGTKEGWTPSTFVSSRQQKAGRQNARPEDFMDEEDLGEHGIAPRQIITTADFASGRKDLIGDKARAITSLSAPIPGDTVLEDLVAPARSSMGVELLRRMGWKDGQGVGPRVKRRLCKQEADPATRVLALPCLPTVHQNHGTRRMMMDLHGLGYRGLNPLAALRGGPGAGNINLFTMDSDRTTNLFGEDKKGQRRRGGVAGQGFGVGAMEDDDEDIYHRDTMSNYDAVLGGEEPGDGLYGWTAPQQYNRKKKVHSKDAAYLGKILEGFTLGSDKMETKTIFPPPDLPRDFRPVHYFRPVVDMSSVSPMVAQALLTSRGHMAQEEPSKGGRHQLDSAQRRELLGETALQGPSSVFDLLKVEDRERLSSLRRPSSETTSGPRPPTELPPRQPIPGEGRAAVVAAGVAAAAAKASAQKALSSRFAPPAEQQQEALSVWSGPAAQAQAGQTFKPFERTAHKQARYDLYIDKLKQGDRDALELSLDPSMTEWERGRERDEFVRAALLYKPSSSSLSCRFTRGKHDDAVEADTVEVTRDQENDVDDKQAAVKMKMFGKLTRDSFEWHPDKLLCKRFNVPDPYPGSGFVGMPKVKRDKFSVFNFLTVSESATASASPAPQAVKPSEPGKRSRWDVSGQAGALEKERKEKDPLSEFLSVARIEASGSGPDTSTTDGPTTDPTVEPDTEKEEEEEESRPPMDLFKAIFASSSDEKSSSSSEGESEEEEEEGVRSKAGTGPQISNQFNVNTSPPAPPVSVSATPSQHTDVMFKMPSGPAAAPPPQDQEMEEEEFGPRLPPPSSTLTAESRPAPTPSAKNDKHKKKCKEKYKAKKHGKHKKDKKQKKKHKRHKHKGKQKKSGRKEESSDSSSEGSDGNSQEEGGGVSTEELLRRLKSIRGKNLQ
ncbi:hypothetical protein J4Q44_G00348310 [Coregonus suidteri]|uniref:G-patch domain-containing protein n=1 Tax=Coregonus suidteri TaxID=861788 RepID=A0AAN8KS63_9TELE